MQSKNMSAFTVQTTVEELINSLCFGPDLKVEGVLPTASAALAKKFSSLRFRLSTIDDTVISNSGDLKEFLVSKVLTNNDNNNNNNNTSDAATPIKVTFFPIDAHEEKVDIESSVICNGQVSEVKEPKPSEVQELIEKARNEINGGYKEEEGDLPPPPPPNITEFSYQKHLQTHSPKNSANPSNNVSSTSMTLSLFGSPASANSSATTAPSGAANSEFRNVPMPPKENLMSYMAQHQSNLNNASVNNNSNNNNTSNSNNNNYYSIDSFNSSSTSNSAQQQQLPVPRRNTTPPTDLNISGNSGASTTEFNERVTLLQQQQQQQQQKGSNNNNNSSPRSDAGSLGDVQRLAEFDAVKLGTTPPAHSLTSAYPPSRTPSNTLTQFVPPQAIGPGGNSVRLGGGDSNEMTVKAKLATAIEKCPLGRCVICVCQEVNPVAELELLALRNKRNLTTVDLGVKLRLRPSAEVFASRFFDAMQAGGWFLLINAHKSINTCLLLDELLADAWQHNLKDFHPQSKIIISLEPHPHFPKRLIHGAVVSKIVANFEGSAFLSASLAASTSRARIVTADALASSVSLRNASFANNSINRSFNFNNNNNNSFSLSVQNKATKLAVPKRKVRISAAVDIVDIAPRDIIRKTASHSNARGDGDGPIDVSGSVALVKTFSGVPNDKFLCVKAAGDEGRLAVGSSFGNVYFLDFSGNSLLQAHAHNTSIWDVCFEDKFRFATGCEDGTAASWQLTGPDHAGDARGGNIISDDALLTPTSATSLGADVFCVSYLRNLAGGPTASPLLIGGLHNNFVIRSPSSEDVGLVPIPSNAQVMDTLPSYPVCLVGGGDGSVSIIDVVAQTSLGVLAEHTRKLPALSVRDDHHFFTGSFDSSILSYDLRVPGGTVGAATLHSSENLRTLASSSGGGGACATAHTLHTLKLKNYVTGLSADDVHLAASVGENLYLWDVRKLGTVLGGYPQGWKGLSRGVRTLSRARLVVTASPDGLVRYWSFV